MIRFTQRLRRAQRLIRQARATLRAAEYTDAWIGAREPRPSAAGGENAARGDAATDSPLRRYFEERRDGRGIWKWRHYFDIYERHFRKFRGRGVHVLEIGVYSGGSLEMWRNYFGPASTIYGVDIEPACRAYENQHTRIFIGDQGDRAFWRSVRADAPLLDIVIDDGSHRSEDQIVSLEELLAHLRPGGVYVCEDLHSGTPNPFISFVAGLAHSLNAATEVKRVNIEYGTPWSGLVSRPTEFQRAIASIHLYPFVAVIERSEETVAEFVAPRHGTEWQPFYE